MDGGVEHVHRRAHALRVLEDDEVVVARGGEEVLVGEAEVAGVVDNGGVLVEGAELLRVLEGGGDAGLAGGGVAVAAAEREGVGDVRYGADASGGEKRPGGGGVLGEGGGELPDVGLIGVVRRIVAALAADLPRRLGRGQWCEEERNEDCGGEAVERAVARRHGGRGKSPAWPPLKEEEERPKVVTAFLL